MNVDFPLFLMALLVHVAICITSQQADRIPKVVQGILVLSLGWPLLVLAHLPTLETAPAALLALLRNAPYYMPFASFLVYLRRRARVR